MISTVDVVFKRCVHAGDHSPQLNKRKVISAMSNRIKILNLGTTKLFRITIALVKSPDVIIPEYAVFNMHIGRNLDICDRLIELRKHQWTERRVRHWVKRFVQSLECRPVYFICDSVDCDHVRGVTAHRAKNGRDYLRQSEDIFRAAEGRTYLYKVTKSEYESHVNYERDYLTEAFENGHSHSPRY